MKNIPSKSYKNFSGDLDFGQQRELDFMSHFGDTDMVKSTDRKIDIILSNGQSLELKSERYNILEPANTLTKKTNCLFIEWSSTQQENKEYGPFRTLAHGVDFYVHYFLDGTVCIFKTKDLVEYLLKQDSNKWKSFTCVNFRGGKRWEATGKLVPLAELDYANIAKVLVFDKKDKLSLSLFDF